MLNAVAKVPFAPMIAFCVTELMVIATISPLGGTFAPLEIVPDRLIELVPTEILCEGVRLLKVEAVTPVPLSPTDCVLFGIPSELSVKVSVADSGPGADGEKAMSTSHTEFPASVPLGTVHSVNEGEG